MTSAPRLIGRQDELGELTSLVGLSPSRDERPGERAGERAGRALLLSGDAGVGKSRLLTELSSLAVAQGWQVLTGHCLDFGDSAFAYLPFSEALDQLASVAPDVLEEMVADRPVLARLQPGRRVLGATGTEHSDGETGWDRAGLFESIHALLSAATATGPLLFVLEDLHWADQSTRDLLSYLFTRRFEAPVSIVGSYRTDDLHRRHPLRRQVAEWARLVGVDRMSLGPLADSDVRELATALAPQPLSSRGLDEIVDRAEGNAFFVEELASASCTASTLVPTELADLLLVRLDRLDDTSRQVVRAASVAGRVVAHDLLAGVSGLSATDLDAGLRLAVEHNILVAEDGHYAFRHALLGEAVHDDLLPGERIRLHAACVSTLREGRARGTAAALARHARLAQDLDTALAASIQAAREASAVGGPDEAAQHYEHALEMIAAGAAREDVDEAAIARAASEALVAAGHVDRAIGVLLDQLTRTSAQHDPSTRARLLTSAAIAAGLVDIPPVSPLELSLEALELAGTEDTALRARVLTDHATVLLWNADYEAAQTPALEALALAERLGLPGIASEAATTLSGLKKLGPREGLRASLRDAVARAMEAGATSAELRGRFLLGRSFQDSGEFNEAVAEFSAAVARAEAAGFGWAPYGFESRWQLAMVHQVRGEWEQSLALARARGGPALQRAILMTAPTLIRQARGEDVSASLTVMRRHWRADGSVATWGGEPALRAAAAAGDPAAVTALHDEIAEVLTTFWGTHFPARVRLAAIAIDLVTDLAAGVTGAQRREVAQWVEDRTQQARQVAQRYRAAGQWGPEGQAWELRLEAVRDRASAALGPATDPAATSPAATGPQGTEPQGTDSDRPVPDRPETGGSTPGDSAARGESAAARGVSAWQGVEAAFLEHGHVLETARVRIRLAEALKAHGDLAAAKAMLVLVQETATALGATTLLADVAQVGLDRSPRSAAGGAAGGLTGREAEVLVLVAQGRTNGEIGKALFISPKTVSVHVSNILDKLGAASRTEAAAIAHRDGLLP